MKIQTIEYTKTFNLGNYSNEKIGAVVSIAEDENPLDAFALAKTQVEKSHKFFQDLPKYEEAKKIVSQPMDFTGRQLSISKEVIEAFEANYPDYLDKFNMPVSRTLEQGKTSDDEYGDDDRLGF